MLSASLPRRWLLPPDLRGCSPSPLRTSRRRTRRGRASSERAPGDDALRLERGRVKSEATRVDLVLLCGLRATIIHKTFIAHIHACTTSSFERTCYSLQQYQLHQVILLADQTILHLMRTLLGKADCDSLIKGCHVLASANRTSTKFRPSSQAQIRKLRLAVVPAVRSTTSSPASSLSRFSWQTQQNQSPSGRASRFAQ